MEIDRLLGPQRAIVVERGNALGHRNEIGRASFVTFSTKAVMDFFAAPSFHDGSGSAPWAVTAKTSAQASAVRDFLFMVKNEPHLPVLIPPRGL